MRSSRFRKVVFPFPFLPTNPSFQSVSMEKESRETVKKYLAGKKGFILVSHDRDFLDACIDHVLVLNRHSIEVQTGNFSSWWENKRRQDEYERAYGAGAEIILNPPPSRYSLTGKIFPPMPGSAAVPGFCGASAFCGIFPRNVSKKISKGLRSLPERRDSGRITWKPPK